MVKQKKNEIKPNEDEITIKFSLEAFNALLLIRESINKTYKTVSTRTSYSSEEKGKFIRVIDQLTNGGDFNPDGIVMKKDAVRELVPIIKLGREMTVDHSGILKWATETVLAEHKKDFFDANKQLDLEIDAITDELGIDIKKYRTKQAKLNYSHIYDDSEAKNSVHYTKVETSISHGQIKDLIDAVYGLMTAYKRDVLKYKAMENNPRLDYFRLVIEKYQERKEKKLGINLNDLERINMASAAEISLKHKNPDLRIQLYPATKSLPEVIKQLLENQAKEEKGRG